MSDANSLELEFTNDVTRDEYYAANLYFLNTAWSAKKLLPAFLASAFMFTAVAAMGSKPVDGDIVGALWENLAFGAGFGALLLAIRYVLCRMQLRRISDTTYEQTGTLSLPTAYHLTQDRLWSSFAEGTSDHPWSRFIDYMECEPALILRRTPTFVFFFPKRNLSAEQLDAFRNLLETVGIKRS